MAQRPRSRPIELDTPRYIGWAILEVSKAHMYRAHYHLMKRFYGARARLLYMDTDSLAYEVETTTLEADMAHMTAHSDQFGGLSFDGTRLGHFKDEAAALSEDLSKEHKRKVVGHFVEYVGLAAKLYGLAYESECGIRKDILKARGIPKHVLVKGEGLTAYKRQLDAPEDTELTFHKLKKHRHSTFLVETTRRGTCAVDTKTFRSDENTALPLGHYKNRGA